MCLNGPLSLYPRARATGLTMCSLSDLGSLWFRRPAWPLPRPCIAYATHLSMPATLMPDVPPRPSLLPRHVPTGLGFEKVVGLVDDSELSEPVPGTLQLHFSNPVSHPETPKLGGTATTYTRPRPCQTLDGVPSPGRACPGGERTARPFGIPAQGVLRGGSCPVYHLTLPLWGGGPSYTLPGAQVPR